MTLTPQERKKINLRHASLYSVLKAPALLVMPRAALKKMYPMNDHTSISAGHVPVSKSAGMAVPSSSIIERSIVATSPGVALAVLSLVAREKERGVDGTKGPFRKKAKP